METRTKYHTHVASVCTQFDVEKLRQEVARLNEEWVNVIGPQRFVCST